MSDDQEKLQNLRSRIRELRKAAVAFSGGVDSSFLLKVAHEELGSNIIAVINATASFSSLEREEAVAMAEQIGVPHQIVHSREMEDDCFLANPPDRCYHCKKELFREIAKVAKEHGINNILDGSNADDMKAHRPGKKAAMELGVLSPLADAGLTKAEIRLLSKQMGLRTADKPQMACLASRIPYNERITRKKLEMVEKSEAFLRSLGLKQLRVRNHGSTARIEVPVGDLPAMIEKREEIVAALKRIGFVYVALDLQGFRSGSMDEVLPKGSLR